MLGLQCAKGGVGVYQITKAFSFSAAHSLPSLPESHKCHRLHGHNYVAEVCIAAHRLDRHGMVSDFANITQAVAPLIDRLDHQNLNDLFDFPTTSENIARHIFDECAKHFAPSAAHVEWVSVSETPKTKAIFSVK
jgi:6-pyruvoyltetrahydropterin/6-carboxytetrahydropterin synthase